MEFGKLENVNHVHWDLPDLDPLDFNFLQALKKNPETFEIYIGAPAWGRKEWIGRIYPPGTPPSDFLFHYSRNFNCIELNTTHYRIPDRETVRTWISKVPSGFLFCPKIPQLISHEPGGLLDPHLLDEWFLSLEEFGSHRGPCFLQLPPFFTYEQKAVIFQFLKSWPDSFALSLEFRHPSWFQQGRLLPALVEYLQSRNIGLVVTDVAGRRDVLHGSVSASFSFLRFIGNNLHLSDFERARAWARRIEALRELGLKRFFFMVHEPDDIKTPEMADWVISELNQTCGTSLVPLAKPFI